MPVDFLPLALGIWFLGILLLTAVLAGFARRPGRVCLAGLLFAASFPAFYVWHYH